MTAMEMITAAQYGIPAKTIILNNDFPGHGQSSGRTCSMKSGTATPRCTTPTSSKLTDAMHCKGFRVTKLGGPGTASCGTSSTHDGPAVLDALVEKHEHVYPMVPAGKTVDDMVLAPAGEHRDR